MPRNRLGMFVAVVLFQVASTTGVVADLIDAGWLRGPKPLPVDVRGVAIAGDTTPHAFLIGGRELVSLDLSDGGSIARFGLPDGEAVGLRSRLDWTRIEGREFLVLVATDTLIFEVSADGVPTLRHRVASCGFSSRSMLVADGARVLIVGANCAKLIDIVSGEIADDLSPDGSPYSAKVGGSAANPVAAVARFHGIPRRLSVRWWSLSPGEPAKPLAPDWPTDLMDIVSVDRTGTMAVVYRSQSRIELRAVATGELLSVPQFPSRAFGLQFAWGENSDGPVLIAFHSQGTSYFSFADPRHPVLFRETVTGPYRTTPDGFRDLREDINLWALSADGHELAFADPDRNRVVRIDLDTAEIIASHRIKPEVPLLVSMSPRPDGRLLSAVVARHWLDPDVLAPIPGGGSSVTAIDWTLPLARPLVHVSPLGLEYIGPTFEWGDRFVAAYDRYQNALLVFDVATKAVAASGGLARIPPSGAPVQFDGRAGTSLAWWRTGCELEEVDGTHITKRSTCRHKSVQFPTILAAKILGSGVAVVVYGEGVEFVTADGGAQFVPVSWGDEWSTGHKVVFDPTRARLVVFVPEGLSDLRLTALDLATAEGPRVLWRTVVPGDWVEFVDSGQRILVAGSVDYDAPTTALLLDANSGAALGPSSGPVCRRPFATAGAEFGVGSDARAVIVCVDRAGYNEVLLDVSTTTPRTIAEFTPTPFQPQLTARPEARVWYELMPDNTPTPEVRRGDVHGNRITLGRIDGWQIRLITPRLLFTTSLSDLAAMHLWLDPHGVLPRSPPFGRDSYGVK